MKANPFDQPTLMGSGARYQEGMRILGGRFVLERQLGRGGMGEVWLARDTELGDHRALKFLPSEVAHDPKALSQLRREAAAGQRLSHPRIVKTHDLHVGDGHAAVAMEYVDGKTLNELQAEIEKGYFEAAEIEAWIKDVCEALDYAHGEAKVVHRDLKPANIIIEKATGRAKVLDFGISRRIAETHTQITGKDSSGTLAYSSLQQMDGDKGHPTDDLYALGATLYELLTGAPPFFRGDLRKQILEKIPPSMTERRAELVEEGMVLGGGHMIPSNWEMCVADCLKKNAAKRPANAMTLWRGLSGETAREEEEIKQREVAEQKRQAEEAWHAGEAKRRAKEEAELQRQRQQSSIQEQARQKRGEVARPQAKSSPLPWIMAACVVMGLVALGVLEFTKKTPEQAKEQGTVAAAITVPEYVNSLGMKFVPIGIKTGGRPVLFSVWETRRQDYAAYAAANSGVDAQWKNAKFEGQLLVHGDDHPVGHGDDHPVVCVSWKDAVGFCNWLTEKERASGKIGREDDYRLPLDAEWSWAAGIGEQEDERKTPEEKHWKIQGFPWGTAWQPPKGAGNYSGAEVKDIFWVFYLQDYEDGYETTAPVGSFGPNFKGLFDLSGNVLEWCWDYYNGSSGDRVLRGGSWSCCDSGELTISYRFERGPGYRNNDNGFRCVLVVSGR